jgi:hypothetical protein
MMLLFRSTFITAISAFILTFCAFSMSGTSHYLTLRGLVVLVLVLVLVLIPPPIASAAPQFGCPLLHVLDDTTPSVSESVMYLTPVASPTGAGVVDLAPIVAVPSSLAPATTQSPGEDPDPNPQVHHIPAYPLYVLFYSVGSGIYPEH